MTGHTFMSGGLFSALGGLWGWLALGQLVQVLVMGESGVPGSTTYCRRATVYWAWIAAGWLLLVAVFAWLTA